MWKSFQFRLCVYFFAGLISLLLSLDVAFYLVAYRTGLQGMRGGPQDAFRHTFASAVVARYASPKIVDWVSKVCERDPLNNREDAMDRHNNAIGKTIGIGLRNEGGSLSVLYEAVSAAVDNGVIDAQNYEQITWLAPEHWTAGL